MTPKLNIRILILAVGLFSSAVLSAQTQLQRMEKDPRAGAGIYCPYSYDAASEVSRPEGGYKPFYISHFGRHGSRYFSRPAIWQAAVDCFAAAHAEGKLTAEGEALYAAMKAVYDAHEDMYGELAPLGAVEHREIARRMYDREKPVFRSKKRNQVRCISSVYSRCIMSMANFTEELSSLEPGLEVSYLAGKRYNNEYLNSPFSYNFNDEAEQIIDSLRRADLDPHSLLSLYFNDAEIVTSLSDPYEVEMGIFNFWAICFDLDFLGIDMTQLIPLEELAKCSQIDNAAKYAKVAVSEEFGKYTRIKGVNLLKDFVAKADDALQSDSKVAADLRFAHDSAFLPLCSLLGIPGYPTCAIDEAYRTWNVADAVPMCSNLQMVFYKGKGDVLVKVLVNEKETVLNGLTPVQGVYYRWDDIKALIEGLESTENVNDNIDKSQNNQLYE
ncbi:MAG: histidine-type phosphatase [Bacteroidales bacterium]|nr:histidine-type phosphatase [Bacteroidales bacterium]